MRASNKMFIVNLKKILLFVFTVQMFIVMTSIMTDT
jgi:hypothetical protein